MVKINSKKQLLILTALGAVLLVAAGTTYLYLQNQRDARPVEITNSGYIDTEPATKDQTTAGEDIKKSVIEGIAQDDAISSNITGQVTSVNQRDGILYIRTILQTVTSAGTCTLNMTGPSDKVYSASVDVQAMPSSTTCKGFDVPVDELTPGSWNITIEYRDQSKNVIMTEKVDIQ